MCDYILEDGARPLLELEATRSFDEILRHRATLLDPTEARYRHQLSKDNRSNRNNV